MAKFLGSFFGQFTVSKVEIFCEIKRVVFAKIDVGLVSNERATEILDFLKALPYQITNKQSANMLKISTYKTCPGL